MARLAKIILGALAGLALLIVALLLLRKPVATKLAQIYLAAHGVDVSLQVKELGWTSISIENIVLQPSTRISHISIKTTPPWSSSWTWEKIRFHANRLDVDQLLSIYASFANTQQQRISPPSPDAAYSLCRQLQERSVEISIDDLLVQKRSIPLGFQIAKENEKLHTRWKAPEFSAGDFFLDCRKESLFLQAKMLYFDLKKIELPELTVHHFKVNANDTFFQWDEANNKQAVFAGDISIDVDYKKENFSFQSPFFLFSLQSYLNNPEKIYLRLVSKNLNSSYNKKIFTPFMEISSSLESSTKGLEGSFHWTLLDLQTETSEPLLNDLSGSGHFQGSLNKINLFLNLWSPRKKLTIKNALVELKPQDNTYSLRIKKENSKWSLDESAFTLLPKIKEWTKSISGQISVGTLVSWEKNSLKGTVSIDGRDLNLQTEFGHIVGMNISHEILSLETLQSPPRQHIFIKNWIIGPNAQEIDLRYEVKSREQIKIEGLRFQIDRAVLEAHHFLIDPLKKRIENFSMFIQNLSLEKMLALGLKETIKSDGRLNGEIKVHFSGQRPLLSGQLLDPKSGYIQYRPGRVASTTFSVSDGPMDILQNYLDNFHYKTLALDVASDKNYDMILNLKTSGHNPQYLNGKPLKLNIKLEQNLLAAMQSLMLTYDLPDKIREKLEKAENE